MPDKFKPADVTYLDNALKELQTTITNTGNTVRKNTLPGKRGKIMLALSDIDTRVKHIAEVLQRSGMDTRLGYVPTKEGIQPVMDAPLSQETDIETDDEGVKEAHA